MCNGTPFPASSGSRTRYRYIGRLELNLLSYMCLGSLTVETQFQKQPAVRLTVGAQIFKVDIFDTYLFIGVGRFRILGGQGLEYWGS